MRSRAARVLVLLKSWHAVGVFLALSLAREAVAQSWLEPGVAGAGVAGGVAGQRPLGGRSRRWGLLRPLWRLSGGCGAW